MNDNVAVSKIVPVCYKKHSYHSYVFLGLSSFFSSSIKDQLTSSDIREIWVCTQSSYGPEPKPGYVRNLSYDPVKLGQEYGRANLLLLSSQIRRVCSLQSQHQNHLN